MSAQQSSKGESSGRDAGFFTVIVENDKFAGTDRDYTSGLKLSYTRPVADAGWSAAIANMFLPATSGRDRLLFNTWAFGQNIYTPQDTDAVGPLPAQHPYAGWLYGEFTLIAANPCLDGCMKQAESLTLQMGVVGPSALGELVQNKWHYLIGTTASLGWANQLRDEPGVTVIYDRRIQVWSTERAGITLPARFMFDILPDYGFAAGNVLTQASAGATIRLGQNFAHMDLPARVRPSTSGAGVFGGPTCWQCFGWYLFASAEGRAVAHDIFLDGNTFRDSLHVDRKPFVADFQLGAVARWGDVELAYTFVTRTEEFETQGSPQQFGSLSVTYRLRY